MSNNKARKYTSPILEELMSEITPEEMKATEQKMLQELNKQSSIEWLEQALEGTILTHEQIMQTIGLFEQAKAMHKEEIINAINIVGEKNVIKVNKIIEMISEIKGDIFKNNSNDAINYYNETYGGNK